jgi:hypothetical protein
MVTAAAADAFMDRVDPNCVISMTLVARAIASADKPGPSWPKSIRHFSGQTKVSMGTQPGTLSMASTGTAFSAAQTARSATVS